MDDPELEEFNRYTEGELAKIDMCTKDCSERRAWRRWNKGNLLPMSFKQFRMMLVHVKCHR